MDLIDRIDNIAHKISKNIDSLETEEATKNALIMPFISNILGYDVFDPSEVVPEFTADVGTKKGEKIDYAIRQDGQVIILIEAKRSKDQLQQNHASQLYRYFSVTHARIAILTNGIDYWFYTDLDATNKMDDKPFMEISLAEFDQSLLGELKKLTKNNFDIDSVLNSAGELKYTRQIKLELLQNYNNPEEDFVRLLAKKVYDGTVTQKVLEQFTDITKRAFKQLINDQINHRLQGALSQPSSYSTDDDDDQLGGEEDEPKIVTTEEEIEGYHIVKGLVRDVIDPGRVSYRDTQSYFGILIDDNNRKPLCRLHLNSSNWYLGLFDDNKKEDRISIEKLDDIYTHGDQLRERAKSFAE